MKTLETPLQRWTSEDGADLYGVRNWGQGYFDVSPQGEVRALVRRGDRACPVSLMSILEGMKERGLNLPALLRFSDLLDARIALLNDSFERAIRDAGYRGTYRGVYPVKVNQQQQVIEEITACGRTYHHGLEAGSKAELIAAMAYLHDPEALIVCNGYKDRTFIDLALYGVKMGLQVMIVLETPSELTLVLDRAAALGVQPRLGVRIKLSTRGSGHWTESAGDRSVFGLTVSQVVDVVDELRRRDQLGALQMLHYHVGSQIPSIRTVRSAAAEAVRIYADLVREGAAMGFLNVGGGLAVDYDGSHTNFPASSNYSVPEYCSDVVEAAMTVADEAGIPHPTLVSESGRATVAYYSVLLFDVLDVSKFESHEPPKVLPDAANEVLKNLQLTSRALSAKNLQESFNDAVYYREELRNLFMLGDITLRDRAAGEQIFWDVVRRVADESRHLKYVPEELRDLENALADVYYGNFSLFQSLPDAWAIDQLFPVMPIHRLHEAPTRRGIVADCTCDCDGKLDRFIDLHDVKRALPLHEFRPGEPYVLGVFMVGAYQETLGDLHNLFGDTNVVTVRVGDDGRFEFSRELFGDSVADVLSYVEYDPKVLTERFRNLAEASVRDQRITAVERREITQAYEAALRGYTYVEE